MGHGRVQICAAAVLLALGAVRGATAHAHASLGCAAPTPCAPAARGRRLSARGPGAPCVGPCLPPRPPAAARMHGHAHGHADGEHDEHAPGMGGHLLVKAVRGVTRHRWWAASAVGPAGTALRAPGWQSFLPHDEDRVTVLGAAVNVLLAALKLAAGIYGRSAAMVADAGHSLSDLVSDLITVWSVRMGRLPPDDDHPYGHGRFEAVGSLLIALILVGTGCAIGSQALAQASAIVASQSAFAAALAGGVSHAHAHALHLAPSVPAALSLCAAVVSLASKEWLYRLTAAVGRRLGSSVVLANAQHHRSDALSSLLAFFGILGARLGLPLLDPIAGLCVCAMVAYTGLEVAADSLLQLTDAVDKSMVARIRTLASESAGVLGCSRVRVRWSGQRLFVDVCVALDPTLSASAAQHVTEGVRMTVLNAVPPAREVLVTWAHAHAAREAQAEVDAGGAAGAKGSAAADGGGGGRAGGVDAEGRGRPLQLHARRPQHEVEADVRTAVAGACGREVRSIEHLTVHYLPFDTAVEVAITVDDELTVRQAARIAECARQAIVCGVADVRLADIHLDLLDQSPRSMYAEGAAREADGQGEAQMQLTGPLRPQVPVQ